MRAAHIDVGGVEYMIDDRDGQLYYYDINALSNFVADAPRVVGFDPFPRLVDYLEREAEGPCASATGSRSSGDGPGTSPTSRWRRAGTTGAVSRGGANHPAST